MNESVNPSENSLEKRHWRSLSEYDDSAELRERLHREFPVDASTWDNPVSRREFLRLMGASFALAGLNSCVKQPDETILPYTKQPEYLVPGKPLAYATAFVMGGFARGILVTSHMGRPTKIEGNPDHPSSLGSTDAFTQASILSLYDPDRSQVILRKGEISTWSRFLETLERALDAQQPIGGAGLRVLTGTVTSPTLVGQLRALMQRFPKARWSGYEPVNLDNLYEGARLAFGEIVHSHYHFDKADVVLSLDADFLGAGLDSTRHAREFSSRRTITGPKAALSRLYVAETMPSVTGSMADHRLKIRSSQVVRLASSLAARLGVPGARTVPLGDSMDRWIGAVAEDLRRMGRGSLVLAGSEQPVSVHAFVHAINMFLGNSGTTVSYTDPAEPEPGNQMTSLASLAGEMDAGRVDVLLMLGTNPAYDAPADIRFSERLAKVPLSVHLGTHVDETAGISTWHLPASHTLESWSDARALDGTTTIMQPLIAPLYSTTRSVHEVVEEVLGRSGRKGHDIVVDHWRGGRSSKDFDGFWERCLHDGVVAGTSLPVKQVKLRLDVGALEFPAVPSGMELVFRPDPTIWDGSFANNGWLQELPKPVTKLTWDNAAMVSPAAAARLSLSNGNLVELRLGQDAVTAPVWIVPGHEDDSVTLHLGYGRALKGRVGNGIGTNANLLRKRPALWNATGLEIRKLSGHYDLAGTQDHSLMEGRDIVRVVAQSEYNENPESLKKRGHVPGPEETLYPPYVYDGNAWGMSIDLNACTGCNACVIACQAENNIPIVGKMEVLNAREMHWIRVDRYFEGDPDDPAIYSQPVPCMHCETAPCEVVCPVAATTHDHEGLNVMTYNRCVGTRYCSNNCPYKVRRFNFLQYSETEIEQTKLMRNPDVTVRNRGVMEKCTYCVQRISGARIEAKKENREIRDGEVVTACESACPSHAIVFGNINDKASRVSLAKADARNYALLAELNTKPRTTYRARLTNRNPELE